MAKKKTEDPGLVDVGSSLANVKHAVRDEFNVSTRDLCRALQCSRTFAGRSCRQFRHIYVSQRWAEKVGLSNTGGIMWSRTELDRMVTSAKVERRTRLVAFDEVIDDLVELKRFSSFCDRYGHMLEHDPSVLAEFLQDAERRYRSILPPEWAPAFNDTRGRAETPWVDLGEHAGSFDELGTRWRTTADRMDYGDDSEEWHRLYWREGFVRLTLVLPDGSTRIFYASDPTQTVPADGLLAHRVAIDLLPRKFIERSVLGYAC